MKQKNTTKAYKMDWAKLARMKDSEIDTSDIPPLGEDFFKNAVIRMPGPKEAISIRVDEDVLSWYRKRGKGYQTFMNEVLRLYMRAKAA